MCQVVILSALLGLLGATAGLAPPRISFPLDSPDRPLLHFKDPDIQNATTLLLSNDGSTLFVGARDAILSLDVSQPDVISMKGKVEWKPSPSEIQECSNKGKNETTDCPNFIRVLQPINATHLYACGSYAYNPHDTYIDTDTLSMVRVSSKKSDVAKGDVAKGDVAKGDVAKGRCPFNPFQRNTAVTVDGELFTGTTSDFRGVKPEIARHLSKAGRPDVSQDSSMNLLEEPTFVSSSFDPSEGKIYFFFTEVGKEYSFVDEVKVSRVAQICKDDVGGQRTLQKRWTSFAKAHLLCQPPKELPFNLLQDVFTLQPAAGNPAEDQLFYGVFTSQWSMGSAQSAVCVFQLDDIKAVFAGNYKNIDMSTHRWNPLVDKNPNLGKCGLANASDAILGEVKRSFLTSDSVKPASGAPALISSGQRYSRLAALRTQAANGKEYVILFLLTESGFLHKVVLLDQGPHIIEEIKVFTQPQLMKSILLSNSKGVVYVGTSEGVTEVPVSNCPFYPSCAQCVLARDPFCGWDRASGVCIRLPAVHTDIGQDVENSNVRRECEGSHEAAAVPVQEYTQLSEVVRLQCLKPANLATVTWTTPKYSTLPQNLYLQSADDTLEFLATPETLGIYHCVSEEDGYEEIVASYDVRQRVSPRSLESWLAQSGTTSIPRETSADAPKNIQRETSADAPKNIQRETSADAPKNIQRETSADAPKNIQRETSADLPKNSESSKEPMTPTREPHRETEEKMGTEPISGDQISTDEEDMGFEPTTSDQGPDFIPTDKEDMAPHLISTDADSKLTIDSQSRGDRHDHFVNSNPALNHKNYHSELVVVSFLLAVCVCMLVLTALYWSRLRGVFKPNPLDSPEGGGYTQASRESTPSLCQDDSCPELKVAE